MCIPLFKAIIFDFDDTLVDTQSFFCDHLDPTLIKLFGENYDRNDFQTAKALFIGNYPFEEVFSQTFGNDSEKVLQHYREATQDAHYQARDGMLAFVKALEKQNVILIILSNRTRLIGLRLQQAGYDPDRFIIYHPKNNKPHPSAYAEVVKDLQNQGILAADAVIIGNHPDDYHALPEDYKTNSTFIALPASDQAKEAFQHIASQSPDNIHIINHISELSKTYGRIFQT